MKDQIPKEITNKRIYGGQVPVFFLVSNKFY